MKTIKDIKHTHVIGAKEVGDANPVTKDVNHIHQTNSLFWDTKGAEILGETSLPHYGAFLTDKKYMLFENVWNKKVLEFGCGSGQSMMYISKRQPASLFGLDISESQINKTRHYLSENDVEATLICSPMEQECGLPEQYFDLVYSIYAIGWTTDLDQTFARIAAYLKQGGEFIFSWSHPIHKCVVQEQEQLLFKKNYFDDSWYEVTLGSSKLALSDRSLSTYINALAKAGFLINQLIEESDEDLIVAAGDSNAFAKKAQMLPVTFVIKATKL